MLAFGQSKREFEMPEGDTVFVMKMYWMCFLYKGDNRTEDSVASAKIQEQHLQRINKLAEEGIIKVAGPFGHNGDLRGLFIYDVDTKEEAEKYAKSDPAIKAGQLRYEIYPWWTGKGSKLD
tara:strand:+ start:3188 stop:3550 length:363 start_codon:yes stop_codon:yes gene_type:complete